MEVGYRIYHYDKSHRLISKTDLIESRSFVKAFLQFLYCITSNLSQNIIDIGNTSRAVSNATSAFCDVTHPGLNSMDDFVFLAAASLILPGQVASDQKGIVIGTGTTAVAVADFKLATIAANGTSASQMVHYGCWGLNYSTGVSSSTFDVERIFKNSSGGSIVVAEIGMYAGSALGSSGATAKGFCILRDVLGATVTVLNGEYLKVKYTITVSN